MQLEIKSNLEGEMLFEALEHFRENARAKHDNPGQISPAQEAVTVLQHRVEALLDMEDDDPTFDTDATIPERLADVGYIDISATGVVLSTS